jgi:hypothetical protein
MNKTWTNSAWLQLSKGHVQEWRKWYVSGNIFQTSKHQKTWSFAIASYQSPTIWCWSSTEYIGQSESYWFLTPVQCTPSRLMKPFSCPESVLSVDPGACPHLFAKKYLTLLDREILEFGKHHWNWPWICNSVKHPGAPSVYMLHRFYFSWLNLHRNVLLKFDVQHGVKVQQCKHITKYKSLTRKYADVNKMQQDTILNRNFKDCTILHLICELIFIICT